jgi:hypothetical protein
MILLQRLRSENLSPVQLGLGAAGGQQATSKSRHPRLEWVGVQLLLSGHGSRLYAKALPGSPGFAMCLTTSRSMFSSFPPLLLPNPPSFSPAYPIYSCGAGTCRANWGICYSPAPTPTPSHTSYYQRGS